MESIYDRDKTGAQQASVPSTRRASIKQQRQPLLPHLAIGMRFG
jgi:hypothetical protein